MFRGATSLNLDAKGRLTLPTKHREAMALECAGNLVVTAHPHRCLLVYPKPAWEPIQAKITALSSFDKQSSGLQRLLVGFAEDVALDGAGRLLVSPELRDFATLDKEVMLVGQGSHFELWSKAAWRAQLEQVMQAESFDMPKELEGFSL
jgi:MraZ protein